MKRVTTTVLLFPILSFIPVTAFAFQADIAKVCFSPRGGCTENVVERINAAKSALLVQAYSFTEALSQSPLSVLINEANIQTC